MTQKFTFSDVIKILSQLKQTEFLLKFLHRTKPKFSIEN
jgi:hypothetical protein